MIVNPYSALEEKKAISQAVSMQPVLSTISWRAANFDIVNDIKYNSLDGYVRARSAYYQNGLGRCRLPAFTI
jgi:ABC-type transporter lipoprotein component MlaA